MISISAPTMCHQISPQEQKQAVHVKRRSGDPDGIALGIYSFERLSKSDRDHYPTLYGRCAWVLLSPPIEGRETGPTV